MANFNFNKVILGGRLTSDPELKTTQSGVQVTSFRLAVNRRGKDAEVDFISVTAWRQTAEFVSKFFRKGSSICIVGTLQTRSWETQDGQKRTVTEVQADEAFFVDSKAESQPAPTYNPYTAPAANAPKFEPLDDSEPLPF